MQLFSSVTDRRRFIKSFVITLSLCALLGGIAAIDSSAHSALGKNAADLFKIGGSSRYITDDLLPGLRQLLRGVSPYASLALELYLSAVRALAGIML